mgnify:CR=1 FL=1
MAKEIIDSVEKLEEELARVREAQRKFSTYTQEQVDKIFLAAAKAANMARIPLAKMAVEETGMGVVEDKIIKNNKGNQIIIDKDMVDTIYYDLVSNKYIDRKGNLTDKYYEDRKEDNI